jgi:hypothetical protein
MGVDPARHRLLFVGGLHRSGTTLLADLIAAHPQASGFSDTRVPADEGQHLQDVYPPARAFGGPGRFGLAPAAHMIETDELVTPESRARLLAAWEPHWDLAKTLLVEKSPPNLIRTRFLQALFPDATFAIVVRHPIPVTLATARWRETRRLGPLLEHWLRCHELFAADEAELERVEVVRYEDLVANAEACVRRVWSVAGLDPAPVAAKVEPGSNEAYFERWRALGRDPRMRAYLTLTARRYERRARRFGYSLVRPERAVESWRRPRL